MNASTGSKSTDVTAADTLGTRIVAAARMATAKHLELDRRGQGSHGQQAMIGGTDRLVTDDNSSVVSGQPSTSERARG